MLVSFVPDIASLCVVMGDRHRSQKWMEYKLMQSRCRSYTHYLKSSTDCIESHATLSWRRSNLSQIDT